MAKVNNITPYGLWLMTRRGELFITYSTFPPCLRERSLKEIFNVEEPTPDHFYWPDLDIDLTREIIEHPEWFPKKGG